MTIENKLVETREELIIENFELKLKLEANDKFCEYLHEEYKFLLEMYGHYDFMAFSVAEEVECKNVFNDIEELKEYIIKYHKKVRMINDDFNKFRISFKNNDSEKIYRLIRD